MCLRTRNQCSWRRASRGEAVLGNISGVDMPIGPRKHTRKKSRVTCFLVYGFVLKHMFFFLYLNTNGVSRRS